MWSLSFLRACASALALLAGDALAQAPTLPPPLGLDEAVALALQQQPLLEAQQQAANAAREQSVAAGALPDPQLMAGLSDLSLGGPERYSLRRESDTQLQLGLRQSFPAVGKRALRQQLGEQEAMRLDAEQADQRRMLAREAGMAWLESWKACRAQVLVRDAQVEAERQLNAVEIAYRAGRGTQADLLAARVALELLGDQLSAREQDEWHARNQLRRWIGADAERPLAEVLAPALEPDVDAMHARTGEHPHVQVQALRIAEARTELQLAQAERRPDWAVQASYGYRRAFSDYASLQFELGLPWFNAQRTTRGIAAAAARLNAAEQLHQDAIRQHRAEIALNEADWQRLQGRFARYDQQILPQAQLRLDAARAGYAAGTVTLSQLLDARRALIDLRLQRLDLAFDAGRHQLNFRYLDQAAHDAPPQEPTP